MMNNFIYRSSIHGVQYLGKDTNIFARLLWMIALAISFSFAITIMLVNFQQWRNQPSVVTSVHMTDIKDINEETIVTICLPFDSPIALIKKYFSSGIPEDLQQIVRKLLIKRYLKKIRATRGLITNAGSRHLNKIGQECSDRYGEVVSDHCEFFRLLMHLDSANHDEVILNYIIHSSNFTNKNFEKFLREKGFNLTKPLSVPSGSNVVQPWNLYALFFERPGENDNVTDLKQLEHFQKDDKIHEIDFNQPGLFEFLILNLKMNDVFKASKDYAFQNFTGLNISYDQAKEIVLGDFPGLNFEDWTKIASACYDNLDLFADNEEIKHHCQLSNEVQRNEKVGQFIESLEAMPEFYCRRNGVLSKDCATTLISESGQRCYSTYVGYQKDNSYTASKDGVTPLEVIYNQIIDTDPFDQQADKVFVSWQNNLLRKSGQDKQEFGIYVSGLENNFNFVIHTLSKTSQDFKSMSISRRGCLYPHEKTLSYFPVYSESNCRIECSWLQVADQCGCVPFHLKSIIRNRNTTCDFLGRSCFKNLMDQKLRSNDQECDCLPDCEQLQAEAKKTSMEMNPFKGTLNYFVEKEHNDTKRRHEEFQEIPEKLLPSFTDIRKTYSMIRLVPKDGSALLIEKTATVTTIDAISNVGGTLGLFLGSSLLSLLELIYWILHGVFQKMFVASKHDEKYPKRMITIASK